MLLVWINLSLDAQRYWWHGNTGIKGGDSRPIRRDSADIHYVSGA